MTTDDWPYLYQQGRWIPLHFLSVERAGSAAGRGSLSANSGGAPARAVAFLLQHGSGFPVAGGSGHQPAGALFRHHLASQWNRDRRDSRGLADCERRGRSRRSRGPGIGIFAGFWRGFLLAYVVPFASIPGRATIVGWLAAGVLPFRCSSRGFCLPPSFRQPNRPARPWERIC